MGKFIFGVFPIALAIWGFSMINRDNPIGYLMIIAGVVAFTGYHLLRRKTNSQPVVKKQAESRSEASNNAVPRATVSYTPEGVDDIQVSFDDSKVIEPMKIAYEAMRGQTADNLNQLVLSLERVHTPEHTIHAAIDKAIHASTQPTPSKRKRKVATSTRSHLAIDDPFGSYQGGIFNRKRS